MKKQPEHVTEVCRKWIGKPVWDCASLVREAMKLVGISMASGATSAWNKTNWAKRGTINTLPKNQIAILYRQDGDKMQHTGVYLGDGTVVDARGSSAGVLHTKIEQYKWTHWGQPEGLITGLDNAEVIEVKYYGKVVASSGSTVNLRASRSTSSERIAKIPVGVTIEVIEESGEWCKINYKTYTGYMMSQFIEKLEEGTDDDEDNGGEVYVRIPVETRETGEQLIAFLKRAIIVE